MDRMIQSQAKAINNLVYENASFSSYFEEVALQNVNFSENVVNKKPSVEQIYTMVEKYLNEDISNLWEVIIADLKTLEINEKQEFITRLTHNGLINKLSRFKITNLWQDVDMLNIFVKDNLSLVADIVSANINNLTKMTNGTKVNEYIIGLLVGLDSDQINTIFNNAKVKKAVEQLTPKETAELLKVFNDKTYKWMQNDVLLDKIISYDINQFNEFLNNIGWFWIDFESKDNFLESRNCDKYVEFINNINEKFYTVENLKIYPEMIGKVDNFIISIFEGPFWNISDNIKETTNEFYKILSNNILTKSNINASLGVSNILTFKKLKEGKMYDLVYKIGDEIYTESYIAYSDEISLENLLQKYNKEIQNDNFTILSFELNQVKSTLLITKNSGYSKGLHQISLEIDGKLFNRLVEVREFCGINLNSEFPNAKTANIISDKIVEYNPINVSEPGIYKVSYKIGNLIKDFYLSSQKENNIDILDIKKYILNNQLVGSEIIGFEKFNSNSINSANLFINALQGKNEVFNNEKYGGDQSDVSSLILDYYNNTLNEDVLIKKAKVLENIVKKYYPDASQMQVINLTASYAECGCGYMAISNALTTYMLSNEIAKNMFKETFGYDLYFIDNEKKWYNTDALALDIYLGLFAQDNTIEDLISNNCGLNQMLLEHKDFKQFFAEHNLVFEPRATDNLNYEQLLTEIINSKNEGYFNILATQNFDMEQLSARVEMFKNQDKSLKNSQKVGTIIEKVGGHAMVITDVDENQNIIVSSWSDKYKFLHDSLQKYKDSWMRVFNVKFEWKED